MLYTWIQSIGLILITSSMIDSCRRIEPSVWRTITSSRSVTVSLIIIIIIILIVMILIIIILIIIVILIIIILIVITCFLAQHISLPGKRSCPGESMAMLEIFLYTVTIVQKYKILPASDEQVILPFVNGLSRNVNPDLRLKFIPRS